MNTNSVHGETTKTQETPLARALLLHGLPPPDRPLVLFIRHAERPDIPHQETGNDLRLTITGQEKSRTLGRLLGRDVMSINTSPISRCQETAVQIKDSSGCAATVTESRVLGDPGAYVYDEKLAWKNWLKHGSERVLHDLMAKDKTPPGLHSAEYGTRKLLEYFESFLRGERGYHICVSHDVVLLPFIASLFDKPIDKVSWPDFLQAASLHYESDELVLSYQSWSTIIPASATC